VIGGFLGKVLSYCECSLLGIVGLDLDVSIEALSFLLNHLDIVGVCGLLLGEVLSNRKSRLLIIIGLNFDVTHLCLSLDEVHVGGGLVDRLFREVLYDGKGSLSILSL
jgi:hypothetical protein